MGETKIRQPSQSSRIERDYAAASASAKRTTRKLFAKIYNPAMSLLPRPAAFGPLPHPVALICIYRKRNVAYVLNLIRQHRLAAGDSAPTLLHGLDGIAPELKDVTVSNGPGARNTILNQLESQIPADQAIMIGDDDAEFQVGTMLDFLRIVQVGGFTLAGISHTPDSICSYQYVRARPHLMARVGFVEEGPFVFCHPSIRSQLFPLMTVTLMGWGTCINWYASRGTIGRAGIIDAVQIRHDGKIRAAYDNTTEQAVVDRLLAENKIERFGTMFKPDAVWSRFSAQPPWKAAIA